MAANLGKRAEFERLMLPQLPAAYNLARWMMRHPADADDMVQDAYLKAFRGFDRFAGDSAKGWILSIVRNTCLTALKRDSRARNVVRLDIVSGRGEQIDPAAIPDPRANPEEHLAQMRERERVRAAVARLPDHLRDIVVLREFEDLSYAEIAEIMEIPAGTVMSRLARARERLRQMLAEDEGHEQKNTL